MKADFARWNHFLSSPLKQDMLIFFTLPNPILELLLDRVARLPPLETATAFCFAMPCLLPSPTSPLAPSCHFIYPFPLRCMSHSHPSWLPFIPWLYLVPACFCFQKLTKSKRKHKKLRKGSKLSPHYLPKRCSWESKYAKWYGCSGQVTPWIKQ